MRDIDKVLIDLRFLVEGNLEEGRRATSIAALGLSLIPSLSGKMPPPKEPIPVEAPAEAGMGEEKEAARWRRTFKRTIKDILDIAAKWDREHRPEVTATATNRLFETLIQMLGSRYFAQDPDMQKLAEEMWMAYVDGTSASLGENARKLCNLKRQRVRELVGNEVFDLTGWDLPRRNAMPEHKAPSRDFLWSVKPSRTNDEFAKKMRAIFAKEIRGPL